MGDLDHPAAAPALREPSKAFGSGKGRQLFVRARHRGAGHGGCAEKDSKYS
jgi:hypothetical protein